ncbi:malonyl-ACP O-methyltransferase BioC [Bacillus sp. 3103sda1]|uniref:malonyl-ACP O-methyltransferase BioC n=1 Tax=Bacillus sp. 3103sda1 TaxID=2953808 RepID=UPI0020A21549|nr:malonyl-ACP O-methyltransferase BioC [Bacillus sp. 3103sda1]MCP1125037.1 malonyl-ACP O-methyltransferase BioC [Bacillus sp. 3103sda1]
MINKPLLQKRFNQAAVSYDQYANVQKKMANQLLVYMKEHYDAAAQIRILELGCGTGYVTEKLAKSFPNATITAVDFAESMIAKAKTQCNMESVTFRCEDIEHIKLYEQYDVMISNATFQWLNDLSATLANLYNHLHEDGVLLFSTFGNKTFHELHTSFQRAKTTCAIADATTVGQTFLTGLQLQELCKRITGDIHVAETCYIEIFTTVREFLQSIRKVGATNSNEGSYCQSPSIFRNMLRIYEQDFMEDGRIAATYHALFSYMKKEGKRINETCTNENKLETNRI